jgi:hypothetical protein
MLSAAGPSAVPLLVELAAVVIVVAGLLARRPLTRLAAATVRRAHAVRVRPRRV